MPRGRKPGAKRTEVATNKPKPTKIERVPVAESETTVNLLGDETVICIGTNNRNILSQLRSVKEPDNVLEGGFCQFYFDLNKFNFSFVPKPKRAGRKITDEQKEKMQKGKKRNAKSS